MKRAPRFPSRWAGRLRTLGTMAVLSVALGACNTVMGAREGTMEYPGSGAGPNAVPVYVVKDKDTVEALSFKYGVPIQTIVSRNKLQPPHRLKPGQTLEMPGAKYVPDSVPGGTTPAEASSPGSVKRESLAPPGQGEPPRSAAPAGQPTPLSPAADSVTVPASVNLSALDNKLSSTCRNRNASPLQARGNGHVLRVLRVSLEIPIKGGISRVGAQGNFGPTYPTIKHIWPGAHRMGHDALGPIGLDHLPCHAAGVGVG